MEQLIFKVFDPRNGREMARFGDQNRALAYQQLVMADQDFEPEIQIFPAEPD